MSRPNFISHLLLQAVYTLFFYFCLLAFAVGMWIMNGICFLVRPLLRGPQSERVVRDWIHWAMRVYVRMMQGSGALVTNRDVLHRIDAPGRGMLIIANHPSILDAPIILSRVPDLHCVFKAALKQNLLIPLTARMAGYLSNDGGLDMLRLLEGKLRAGERVLMFPEGTRTNGPAVDKFNASYALAALRAKVPVQLIAIRSHSPVLTKKQHFLRPCRFPAVFEICVGPLIEPQEFLTVQQMNRFVQDWMQQRLTNPQRMAASYLPARVTIDSDPQRLCGNFRVPADPLYCRGHMPAMPLVPAYVQLAWSRELLELGGHFAAHSVRYFRWKFVAPVRPGDALEFDAQKRGDNWQFTFQRGDEKLSHGRVILCANE